MANLPRISPSLLQGGSFARYRAKLSPWRRLTDMQVCPRSSCSKGSSGRSQLSKIAQARPGLKHSRPFHDDSVLKARHADLLVDGQSITSSSRGLQVRNKPFGWLFLRDACSCPRCVDSSTSQRLFETSHIPSDISGQNIELLADGQVEITWNKDVEGFENHKSSYSAEFFNKNTNFLTAANNTHSLSFTPKPWDKRMMEENVGASTFEYRDYMADQKTLFNVARQMLIHGLVFVKNVPIDANSVSKVAERIGPLRNTFYGETWDVRSVPSAKNVAYTSTHLGFHQDLLYMINPPGLQLLHVMKSSTTGGLSLFADAVSALKQIQQQSSKLTTALRDVPVTYHYNNDGHWYQYTRPTLEGGHLSRSDTDVKDLEFPLHYEYINYSPQFQGPFQLGVEGQDSTTSLADYHEAVSLLREKLETPENIYETKMDEGTCVIFNNRRIVHARTAFSSTKGERWLRGAYVDFDPLMSLWRTLDEKNDRTGAFDVGRAVARGYVEDAL